MPGFVWYTNHRMWKIVPPFVDSRDVLKAYIVDPCAYVYWSTPRLQDEIDVGAIAYIFHTGDDGHDGIVARGTVVETPRQFTATSLGLFAYPDRLTPPGWDEVVAPSAWKTGIRIAQTFWDRPISKGVPPAIGAVGRVSEDGVQAIESEIAGR